MNNTKKKLATLTLCVPLLTSCAGNGEFSQSQMGTAIGAVGGAVLGAAVSGKKDRTKGALIGGVLGALAGGAIGNLLDERDRARLAESTRRSIVTGREDTGRNPETGVQARTTVAAAPPQREQRQIPILKDKVEQVPPLEFIGEDYAATGNVNVRGGPGTDYKVVGDLRRGQTTRVVGKVIGADWYMVAEDNAGSGFVAANLLKPTGKGEVAEARAPAAGGGAVGTATVATTANCRVVTQEVKTKDGRTASEQVKACQGPFGWEIV